MYTEKKIRKLLMALHKAYGKPVKRRATPPIDELIRTILSQNTSDKNSVPAFWALKKKFGSWDKALNSPVTAIVGPIRHAGLANIKAKRIRQALAEIKRREGRVNLANLTRLDIESAMEYLVSLGGVGPKTASCVLLFSFGKPVMPVDTHIFRVTKRIGLIDKKTDIQEAHKTLSKIIPKDLIYDFHLSIIEHGRRTCRARNPACGSCVLYRYCISRGRW